MTVGYTVLALWFAITPALFLFFRPSIAAMLGFLGASLFLPNKHGVDLPMLPPAGKEEIASVACLIGFLWFALPSLRRVRLGRGPEILVLVMAAGAAVSVFFNQDSLSYGMISVSGTKPTDILARGIEPVIVWGIPFVIGRALFVNGREARNLLLVMALAGVVYSLFILVELRMSPQFHRWTYGFHQHSFSQTIRDSGYRPMVYMRHGLHLGLFVALSLTATLGLVKLRFQLRGIPASWVAVYLAGILVLCKSTGALAYGMMSGALILLTPPKMQMRAAVGLCVVIVSYPLIRGLDVIPVSLVHEIAEAAAGPQRAKSLTGRMYVEAEVIERTVGRMWFGWGSAGRAMARDPLTGKASLVFDGFWVVGLARGGIVQVAAVFGLLLAPVFMAWRALPRIRAPGDRTVVACLSLMVVINVVDLLPNSTTEGYLTLFSGALAGVVPGILREQKRRGRSAKKRSAPVRTVEPDAGLGGGLLGGTRSPVR